MFSGRQNNRGPGDERIGRLLVGAVGGSPVEGPCPTPEQIAALLDGALKGSERDAVLSHISVCGRCREVFQTAAGLSRKERPTATGRAWHLGYLMPYAAAAAVILAVVSGVIVYRGRFGPSGQNVAMNYAPAKDEKSLQEGFSDKGITAKAKTRPEPATRQKEDSIGWDDARPESLPMSEMPEPSYEAEPPTVRDMKHEFSAFAEIPPPPRSLPAGPEPEKRRYDEYREGAVLSEMPVDADAGHEDDWSMDTRILAEEKPSGLKDRPNRECAAAPKGGVGICRLPESNGNSTSVQGKMEAVPEKEATPNAAELSNELTRAKAAEAPVEEAEPEVVKARGTILQIDIDKGEFVFVPEDSSDRIVIEAGEPLVRGFKAGDKVIAQYEKGDVNIAIRLKKWRAISAVGC